MKRILISLTLLLAFFIHPNIATAQQMGVISVSGKASINVLPDTLYVSVEVQTNDKNAHVAMKKNNEIAQKAIKALSAIIDKTKGDTVETQHISVTPQYIYPKNKERILTGYMAKNSVKVKTQNTKLAATLVSTALKNGANRVNNLYFKLEDKDKYCDKLIGESVKKAYRNAKTVANSLGSTLAGVKKINSHCGSGLTYYPRFAKGMHHGIAGVAPENIPAPITPKHVKVEATTNAEFYVKN